MRIGILVITLFTTLQLFAQVRDLSLRHYSTAEGLSDNNVRCILEDSQGFIWLGTDDGLNRFDGTEFISLRRHNGTTFSLSGNIVTDIAEDVDGTLWICSRDGGICQLNPRNGYVYHPKLIAPTGAEQNLVHCVFIDGAGSIYVGTDKGLFISHDKKFFYPAKSIRAEPFYDILMYRGSIVAATNIRSLVSVANDSIIPIAFTEQPRIPYPAHSLNDLYLDARNALWAGAWDNQLHRYDSTTHRFSHIPIGGDSDIFYNDDEIVSIHETSPGVLWIGMKSFQVIQYHTDTQKAFTIPFSNRESDRLNGHRIHFIYTDSGHRTWIGTDNGLHLNNPNSAQFRTYPADDQSTITGFTEFDHRIIASSTDGLYELRSGSARLVKMPNTSGVRCYSLLSDHSQLWVGTNSSIQNYDVQKKKLSLWTHQKNVEFDINNIASSRFSVLQKIQLDGNPYLLAVPFGHGVMIGEIESHRWALCNVLTQNNIENLIRNVHQDQMGRLWILGSSYGLTRVDAFYETRGRTPTNAQELFRDNNKTFYITGTHFSDGLLSKEITALAEQKDGTFWISTQGAGLYSFNPNDERGKFISIESPWQSMQNMVMDQTDHLWIVASGGLLQYEIGSKTWRRYDQRDGIPKAGLSYAMYLSAQGEMFLGGNGFVLSFDPNALTSTIEHPKPRLTHFTVMDQPMDTLLFKEHLELSHDQNFLSFAFTGLCYTDPQSVVYEYRLDGLDQNWRSNGNNHNVSYSNLPPGEYTFHLRAKGRNGSYSEQAATYSFNILAPFYQRWWFIATLGASIALASWFIYRYIQFQKQKIAQVRNKIARDLHDDIGSTLGSISFFSETAMRTLQDQNDESTKNILEKIGSTSREMIENMHDIVWTVSPNNDGMQSLVDRMKTYAMDMASSGNLILDFKTGSGIETMKLTMNEKKNIYLLYKEAIFNSFKYAQCNHIEVHIEKSPPDQFHLSIFDDGIGFVLHEKSAAGNGIRNMRTRMNEIGAKLEIQTAPLQGTRIEIWL